MFKKWWFWTIILLGFLSAFLLGLIILSATGSDKIITEKEQQVIALKDENYSFQGQIEELKEQIATLQKDEEQKEIDNKIQELKSEQEDLEKDIESKKEEKSSLEEEIEKLNGDVITVKGKAKSYPAGQLVAGEDFEAGRYKIYGGSSNFIVYSRYGDLEVNTILGDWGVDEYVYTFNNGDEIEAHSSFKMQPIN